MSGLSYTQPIAPPKMSRSSLRATEPFKAVAREFWLHNASPDDIKLEWHGETRVIPALDRVSRKHPRLLLGDTRYADVPHSILVNGEYLPGTLILRDLVSTTGAVTWSAEEAIRVKLGINPETGAYEGAYAMRGLSVIPSDAKPEEIADIVADGKARYMTWVERNDRITLLEWEAAIANHKAKKLPAPAPPEYVEAAASRLRDRAAKRNTSLHQLLSEGRNDENTKVVMGAALEASQPTAAAQAQAEEIQDLRDTVKQLTDTVKQLLTERTDREKARLARDKAKAEAVTQQQQ